MRIHTSYVHEKAKVNYLVDRRLSHVYIEGHRRSCKSCYIKIMSVRTRSADGILLSNKLPHGESYKRSLEYTVSNLWNSLDPGKRNARYRNSSKFLLKRELKGMLPKGEMITSLQRHW